MTAELNPNFLNEHTIELLNKELDRDQKIYTLDETENICKKLLITNILNVALNKNNKKYDPNDLLDIYMTKQQYDQAVHNIINKSHYFQNEASGRKLFYSMDDIYTKPVGTPEQIFSHYKKAIFKLLKEYAIYFGETNNKSNPNQKLIDNKKKEKYVLSVDKELKNIVDYKHGLVDKVDAYPLIFRDRSLDKK